MTYPGTQQLCVVEKEGDELEPSLLPQQVWPFDLALPGYSCLHMEDERGVLKFEASGNHG